MSDWIRVNKGSPCSICGHDSWCTYNSEVVICMRVQGGREKVFKDGCVGWIHRLGNDRPVNLSQRSKPKPEVTINATRLMEEFKFYTQARHIEWLRCNLGVSYQSLSSIGCAWADPHNAYAFPMFNGYGDVVGIRLRSKSGKKWAVTGSNQGIFLPNEFQNEQIY